MKNNKRKNIGGHQQSNQITNIRRKIMPILREHDVKRAALFGSFARGEDNRDSDLDILVEFKGSKSLFDLVGLKQALEATTRRNVDILTYHALHPAIRDRILSEQVILL